MPFHKFPPKNYYLDEFPLPHQFSYRLHLAGENEVLNTTICTLARYNKGISVTPDAVEVNPLHSSFGEETGPTCQPGSIVPRMHVDFTARIPNAAYNNLYMGSAAADAIEELVFNWMPIYTAFTEPMDAVNEEDGLALSVILGLETGSIDKVQPIYNGTDLLHAVDGDHPLTTLNDAEAFGDWGLGTDMKMEGVAFDTDAFFDTLKYGTNSSMLKKIIGKWNTVRLKQGHAYHFSSSNYMFPSVKRMNTHTFCGILFHLPQADSSRQLFGIAETTATIAQLKIDLNCHYDEWNPNFDQTVN